MCLKRVEKKKLLGRHNKDLFKNLFTLLRNGLIIFKNNAETVLGVVL